MYDASSEVGKNEGPKQRLTFLAGLAALLLRKPLRRVVEDRFPSGCAVKRAVGSGFSYSSTLLQCFLAVRWRCELGTSSCSMVMVDL